MILSCGTCRSSLQNQLYHSPRISQSVPRRRSNLAAGIQGREIHHREHREHRGKGRERPHFLFYTLQALRPSVNSVLSVVKLKFYSLQRMLAWPRQLEATSNHHKSSSESCSLADSQSMNCSSPDAMRRSRSARTSPCQAGEATSWRDKSARSVQPDTFHPPWPQAIPHPPPPGGTFSTTRGNYVSTSRCRW